MSKSVPIFQVDAFAHQPFSGNPAAVCLLDAPASERWMQQMAAEMNLSETAFLLPEQNATYGLRWFTPTTEVELCGHATLAAAHVLWENKTVSIDTALHFSTLSGTLGARHDGSTIWLDFPAEPVHPCTANLDAALGATCRFVGENRMDLLVELADAQSVRELAPDMATLAQLPQRGVIVTARSDDPQYDFISRFFAPGAGIPEDPVTGSAHCALMPYWWERTGRRELTGYQASQRGGVVQVALNGARVALGGTAVTVLTGRVHGRVHGTRQDTGRGPVDGWGGFRPLREAGGSGHLSGNPPRGGKPGN